MRLEPVAPRSRVKHSATEPLGSLPGIVGSGKNVGWQMVNKFLGKDEKNTSRNLYFLSLKTSFRKRSQTFFHTVYPSQNHVTTHPVVKAFAIIHLNMVRNKKAERMTMSDQMDN